MKKIYIYISFILICCISCSKGWLEVKRDISYIVPTTLTDMRLLLNDDRTLAKDGRMFAEMAADDYYCLDDQLNAVSSQWHRNTYLRLENIYEPNDIISDWEQSYRQVFIANVALEGLEKIKPTQSTQAEYNDVKGNALFFRAKAFFNLTEIYAKPYDPVSAATDLGIPLRLVADINYPNTRSTVQETWSKITFDLQEAVKLLKPLPTVITHPSRCAANALLARVYLCLQDYEKALYHANESLKDKNDLLDYNSLSLSSSPSYPIPRFNNEIIMHSEIVGQLPEFMTTDSRTQRELYDCYEPNDLRKQLFFRRYFDGEFTFQGTYSGNFYSFTGFATDEMYLTRAECNARLDNPNAAMLDINTLLKKRYKQSYFTEQTATNANEALQIVLLERRKQLLRRGLRWSDIRRLNKEPQFQKSFTRTYQEKAYTLTPERIKTYQAPFPKAAFSVTDFSD